MAIPAGMLFHLSSYGLKDAFKEKVKAAQAEGVNPYEEGDVLSKEFVYAALEDDAYVISDILSAFDTGKYQIAGGTTIKDLLMTKDYPKLFYAATEILMRERIVPARVVSANLFDTIPYDGNAINVTIRTLGGVEVEEVPEGGPYPETATAVSDQAYRINLEIKKYGAKVAATKELIESDNWGIYAYTVRSLAEELLNKKEKLCIEMLNEQSGHVLKDNADAANAPLGSCNGRSIDGNQNGAMVVDDIMDIMAYMQMRGYNMDTVLMHPFAWTLWARDTEIREVIMGGGVTHIPQGQAAPGWEDPFRGLGVPYQKFGSGGQFADPTTGIGNVDPVFGKLGIAPYAYPNLTPFGATFQLKPKYSDRPLKVLVSPFVPYYKISGSTAGGTSGVNNPNGKYATNLIFADSTKCGLILQKENAVMEEWQDFEREINFVKIRERYGMAMQEQGRAVAVAKNVIIDRTYNFDNVNSQTLSPLMPVTNMV
jgi:hypothetical protein